MRLPIEDKFSVIHGDFIIENCPQVMTGAATAHLDKSFWKKREVRATEVDQYNHCNE